MFVKKAFLLVVFIGAAVFAEEEEISAGTETQLPPEIDEKVESVVENLVDTVAEEDAAARRSATEAGATGGGVHRRAIQAAIQQGVESVNTLYPETAEEVRTDARGGQIESGRKSNLQVIAEKLKKRLLTTTDKKKRKVIKKIINQTQYMLRNQNKTK